MQSSNPDLQKLHLNSNLPQDHHKIKPILRQSASWRCLFRSDISCIKKYKPKMLSNITISNLKSEKIGANGLKGLRTALIDTKRVSCLTLKDSELDSKQLTLLFNSTNQWRKFSFLWSLRDGAETVSRFGRCKNIEIFPLGENERIITTLSILQHVNTRLFTRIYRQLRKLNHIKSLLLNVPFYINAPIKLPKSLQDIHIIFQSNAISSQQTLPKFIKGLEKCSQLEHLSITFSSIYLFGPSDVQIWASFFQNPLRSFKKLTLNFSFNREQQFDLIQYFTESLKHLKGLTSLDLSFQRSSRLSPLEDTFFSSLFASIQSLNNLKNLKLTLISFPTLKTLSTRQLALMLQSLKNIQNLQLGLPSLESPDADFVFISEESLKNLIHLNTLDLRLPKINLSHKSMDIFSTNIAHHKLTSLSLSRGLYDFVNFQIPSVASILKSGVKKLANIWKNDTLIPFFSNLSKFTQLSALDLRLSAFDISVQEWKLFSAALRRLEKLSSLTLTLPKFDSDNNFEGFQSLFSCLRDLPKLSSLNLTFQKQTTNQEVDLLASFLAQCQNLSALRLQFRKASQLGDECLYSLLYGIRDLLALECLELMVRKEEPFGVKAANEFVEGLAVLKNLSRLLFYGSTFSSPNSAPLPINIKYQENMRRLVFFSV